MEDKVCEGFVCMQEKKVETGIKTKRSKMLDAPWYKDVQDKIITHSSRIPFRVGEYIC